MFCLEFRLQAALFGVPALAGLMFRFWAAGLCRVNAELRTKTA
jgi:hypothetical protein